MASDTAHPLLHTLFSEHHRWLTARLLRHVQDRHDAEDLCAETFFQLLFHRTDLSAIEHPRGFLMRIGQRLVYRRYRERELERVCMEALAQGAPETAPSPEELALLVEAVAQLDAALYGLPAAARAAFFYSQVDGLGYDEIARRLDVTPRTVARYMKQALQCCLRNGLF
ncbi:FIG006045: Sigma factor, ECF subfamily [plant metagenome]|uniref:FIG006045: Sigma factor, ECF subfamily n=1 Tax=plant metagenome TaxID=1297885 RepID=A0A484RBG3_9ZZZZ